MVRSMIDSLFDKKTMKKFDDLAAQQAELEDNQRNLVKETMRKINSRTFIDVFEVVKAYGHPCEQKLSAEIEKKYFLGEELEFDDLINLDSMYKSNFENFSKKDDDDE